jgi:hypothetical protein
VGYTNINIEYCATILGLYQMQNFKIFIRDLKYLSITDKILKDLQCSLPGIF